MVPMLKSLLRVLNIQSNKDGEAILTLFYVNAHVTYINRATL